MLAASAVALVVVACGGSPEAQATIAWHLVALHADPHRMVARGDGVVIAFVDTGLTEAGLPGLAGRHVAGTNVVTAGAPATDVNGHGTEMAVIAAGSGDQGVWGVAPDAKVLPIVVTDEFGHATADALAGGILWASRHGAAVINVSLASDVPSAEVAAAIQTATEHGSLVVASAGDVGQAGPEFPASVPGVVAVYGQDRDGGLGAHSNSPLGEAVLAPGEGIETVEPTSGGLRTVVANGTSAAAAVVSGLLAACLSSPDFRPPGVEPSMVRCERLLYQPRGRFLDLRYFTEVVK